jgi:3-deoxy-D-manno-octulosonic-acid transferase
VNENLKTASVLIIDKMGILSKVYRYGTICYIGGGLKKSGHHNILEAAVYSKAVVTGPHIEKFSESVAMNESGGSFIVKEGQDLWKITNDANLIEEAGIKAGAFVSQHLGATKKIMDWIEQSNLLKK